MTVLTAYLTATNDTLLTTARQLASAAPAAEASVASGQFAKSATGWTELYAQGGNATLAGVEPAPSGHGFLFDVTTLEAQQIAAGNWTPTIKLSTGGGTFTATIVVRAWKRSSAGVYTQIGADMSLAAVALSSTATAHAFAAASLPAMTFAVGDKLYIDVLLNITTGSTSNTASQRVVNLFENGGANDAVVTPGYQPLVTATDAVAVGDSASRAAQSPVRSGPDTVTAADSAHASVADPRPRLPALIAHAVGYGNGAGTTATTGAIDTTGATLLVAAFSFNGSPILNDSKGNTWTFADQSVTDLGVAIWYCRNPIVGAGHTFSLHADFPHLSVDAFSGVDIVAPLDAAEHVDATGGAASVHMPAVAARAYELAVTADGGVTGNNNTSIDQGFVLDDPGGGLFASGAYWGLAIAHKILATAQTVDPTWSDVTIHGAVLATFKPTPGDTVAVSDTASASVGRARTAVDGPAISDVATRAAQSQVRSGPDALTIGEQAGANIAAGRQAADAAAIADSAAGRSTLTHGSSDTVTIADIAPDAIAAARAAVDAIALTLTASSLVAPTRVSLDSVTLGDVGVANVMLGRTGVDTLSLGDVASGAIRGGGSQADDALSIVDDAQRAAQALDRNVTDHAAIADQAGRQAVSTRTTADVVAFADIAVRAEPRARTSADAFGISDNATRGPASAVRYTADVWPVTDRAARLGSQARSAGDAIALNDTAIAGEPPPVPPEQPFLHTEAQPRLHVAATPTLRTAGEPILHTETQPRLHRERQPRTA